MVDRHVTNSPVVERITQLSGDSRELDYTPYRGTIDFVFTDAGHRHDMVANDSQAALELARDRSAALLWHDDGTWPGTTRAVHDLIGTMSGVQVFHHIEGATLACLIT